MVMNHFEYLITDYDFFLKKMETSERAPETEGLIEFETSKTFVTVSAEQWAAGACVGRVKDDKHRFFLDPSTIHEYVTLAESDKKLVCSLDPRDDRKARALIHQIRLSHKKNDNSSLLEEIDSQIANYALWLRRYATPFLQGDFSQWLDIYEYKVARNRAAHIRSGKKEFVRVAGMRPDEKESIFQTSLDYLAKLRSEFGKK